MKTNIYTISAINLSTEEDIDCKECYIIYYSIDEAISSAIDLAKSLHDEDDVYNISVFCGEKQDDNGNISGEPMETYTISNKPRQITIDARLAVNYVRGDVDGYVTDGEFEFEDKNFKL